MSELTALSGIGEKKAELMAKLGINNIDSLLRYFPRGYEDRSKTVSIADADLNENVCIRARCFSAVKETRIRRNMTIYSMLINDDNDAMSVMWYNNRYVKTAFRVGEEYIFYGKVVLNRGRREMVNPVYESISRQRFTGRVVPIYPLCEGLTQTVMRQAVEDALKKQQQVCEYLPEALRKKYQLCEISYAVRNVHFPGTQKDYEIARRRFVFEELFMMQLALLSRRKENEIRFRKPFADVDCNEFIKSLPFELTGAQKRVIGEIAEDMSTDSAMSRLVQGDVGSGKTAVAACAIYMAVKNKTQAVMMAPTEILAIQHYESFLKLFEPFGMRVELLTSASKGKKAALERIASGETDIVVGTHAVIQKNVEFKRLGLCVTDEQHRFGVAQRSELIEKGENPNVLVMTATPIPRTLALILYGDLKSSVINELPPGRKPVKTYAVGEDMRKRVYAFLEKNVSAGMQAYVICPLVEETEKSDLENAVNLCERLKRSFPLIKTGLIHGRMKSKDKDAVMAEFVAGDLDVLVSTTVIEVGVNVPNSNMMIIENAERFGLSQLHQLRGRVGRGAEQAFCIMIAHGNNEITKQRMQTMCASGDGFYIAEQDLKLRGPGDFFGTRQHGLPELKIANLFEDADILAMAQAAATDIIKADPQLTAEENLLLKQRIDKIIGDAAVMN